MRDKVVDTAERLLGVLLWAAIITLTVGVLLTADLIWRTP